MTQSPLGKWSHYPTQIPFSISLSLPSKRLYYNVYIKRYFILYIFCKRLYYTWYMIDIYQARSYGGRGERPPAQICPPPSSKVDNNTIIKIYG